MVKLARVPGTMMIVWAKMIGITPAVMSRIGMKVFWPWVIRPRPITFLGIWTGIRRAAMVMPTTAAVTAIRITMNSTILGKVRAPDFQNWTAFTIPGHNRSRIEKVMSRLIPLPMPRSVICSPSHMTKMAPVVRTTTIVRRVQNVGAGIAPGMDSVNSVKV